MSTTDHSEAVADALWTRVRTMAARVADMEAVDALGDLDEDGRARLAILRMRCSRAAGRARMADELADQMADVQRARRAFNALISLLRGDQGGKSPLPRRFAPSRHRLRRGRPLEHRDDQAPGTATQDDSGGYAHTITSRRACFRIATTSDCAPQTIRRSKAP